MKKRCLFASKAERARGFGVAVVGIAIGAGDIGGLQRLVEVAMDDLKRIGVGVVDADLLDRQFVLDDLVLDAFERQ